MNICAVCGRTSEECQVNYCTDYGNYLCSKHKNQWIRNGKISPNVKPELVCEFCKASNKEGYKIYWCDKAQKFLCPKHRSQYNRLGKFLARTKRDRNEYVLHENYAEIVFRDNHGSIIATGLIDIDDVSRCSPYKWFLTEFMGNTRYIKAIVNNTNIGLHRFVLNAKNGDIVDHINRDGTDNRKSNLRIVSASENSVNSKTRSATKEKNIYFKNNKYQVQITRNYHKIYCETFHSLEEAIVARDTFIKRYNEENKRCV